MAFSAGADRDQEEALDTAEWGWRAGGVGYWLPL